MALSIVPSYFSDPNVHNPFARARERAASLAAGDGHQVLLFPDLCLYRFTTPSTLRKAATFGVTLGVVLEGEQRVLLGKTELAVDPSQLLVITREVEFVSAVTKASPERPYLGLGVCFGPERVARALVSLAEAGGKTPAEKQPAFLMQTDSVIAGAVERLLATVGDPLDEKLLAPLVLDELLFRLLRSDAAAAVRSGVGPANDAQRILEAMQFIRSHHADKLNVARLAKRAAMSPSHFAHRFRAVARVSPMRYLREVRLDRARARLLESGARVSEVARAVGFESAAHFTREFKRRFGLAPSRAASER
jgi:AraC-like DNA-binding protein